MTIELGEPKKIGAVIRIGTSEGPVCVSSPGGAREHIFDANGKPPSPEIQAAVSERLKDFNGRYQA